MKYTVKRRFRFCCAHRLMGHGGKCANLHGHNYEAVVHVQAEDPGRRLNVLGMVMYFGNLKVIGDWIEKSWDHALLLNSSDPLRAILESEFETPIHTFNMNPTVEVMAERLLLTSTRILSDKGFAVVKVELWETPDCGVEVEL